MHADEFDSFDHLEIGDSSDFPWEIFHNRPSSDLALEEFTQGRALILYPEGYKSTDAEAELTYSGRLERDCEKCSFHFGSSSQCFFDLEKVEVLREHPGKKTMMAWST